MKTAMSRDQMLLVKDGRKYVFVPHKKPRCRLCAFYYGACDVLTAPCSSRRDDSVTGYWKEAP